MKFIWKIEWLSVVPSKDKYLNVVIQCGWRCAMVDDHGSIMHSDCGIKNFELNEQQSFVQYENLSQDIVLTWLFEKDFDKQVIEEQIKNEHAKQNEMLFKPLPWISKE